MALMESMDVDISNDFDDKENSLQNSNVLPRTPSTEKGYEELDVSELNMKLRYSMTPASSPMSRSFTANCRDNTLCDNMNNSINTTYNDNSILSRSFNSTVTDSILKSSKCPLQVLPTEQCVDDNGNPISRSLDFECNNVTITINGTDSIDDNISLPSTSSSLVHTPEATTPTKDVVKDGGSPIMRGLKSVLNMFRSSQSPIPPDDLTTNDLNSFESQKKEEAYKLSSNVVSTPTTTNKNLENVTKTNSPLKESLVFNEGLEKELLWKDEITIVFKEEKIPVHKLFFPSNSESLNSKPIEKQNMNTTVEYMDVTFEETIVDKHKNKIQKMSSLESDTLNSPESDSEFVDCETSYTKNYTSILSPEKPVADVNTFQPSEIVDEKNSLSVAASNNLTNDTNAIINIDNVMTEADIDENCNNDDLSFMKKSQINILSDSFTEDISTDLDDKSNIKVNENVNKFVQSNNVTFDEEKYSDRTDLQIGKEHKNDFINKSDIEDQDRSLCEEGKEDSKEFYQSPITKEIEKSRELACNLDSTIVLNEVPYKTEKDTLNINNKTLPLEEETNLDVQDQIINLFKSTDMALVEGGKVFNIDNKCNVKLDSEVTDDTIIHNNTFALPDNTIQIESKELKTDDNNLPSNIPLPYESDNDKENVQDINEEDLRENNKSVDISSNDLNLDLLSVSINQTIDGSTSIKDKHSETISYPAKNIIVLNTSLIETPHFEENEDISHIRNNTTANSSDTVKSEINNTEKCTPTVVDDTIEVSSKIIESVISISNNNCTVSEIDLDALKHQTQDIQHLNSLNHYEFVQMSKKTDDENKIVSAINDKVSHFSTNNNTSITEMELDFCDYDSKDKEIPVVTNNSFTKDIVLQNRKLGVADDKSFFNNKIDVQIESEKLDIPIANINTSAVGMDLDVSCHESENIANPNKSSNKLSTSVENPNRDSSVEGVVGTKYDDSIATIANDKNEITIETDIKISLEPSVAENELEVINPALRYGENASATEEQLKSTAEERGSARLIENLNENNDGSKERTSVNNVKINEVINIPSNSNNSVTEMELDVSNNYEISDENQIQESCSDTNVEDCEIINRVEITSKNHVTVDDELVFPLKDPKDITSDRDVMATEYENIESTSETEAYISSSPPICSSLTQNGYNINFDEIDDPFKTKTNIRMSPTAEISKDDLHKSKNNYVKKDFQRKPQPNRRKTLHDRKEPHVAKNRPNTSFNCEYKENKITNETEENLKIQETHGNQDFIGNNINSVLSTSDKLQDDVEINLAKITTFIEQTENSVEHAENNTSHKKTSSPNEIFKSKNVFNLPEIDDINFNPLSKSKSRINQCPTKKIENISCDKSNLNDNLGNSSDVCYNPLKETITESSTTEAERNNISEIEPNLCPDLSNLTSSSKNTDDVASVREVRTEDEDTVEGPFLEAEDFADAVKVVDFDTKNDMMNFENLPTPTNDDNENGEFFIDAEAFEFLLNQNKSNVVADSGKESLFLKFDPLFAKRVSSDGVLSALNKIQNRQSTPKKLTPLKVMHEESITPGPSTTMPIGESLKEATDIVEEPVAAISKPMMVVNPAIASIVSARKSTTPPRVNRRSLTFTSPAMAVIDRLLSLSGNSSSLDPDSSLPQNRECNETDFALTQLRELLAEKEIHVHNLRSESKELKERLGILETQVRSLETESVERLSKIKELNEHLSEKNKINKSMAIVVEEYERTIASLIAEMEQEKKQNAEERLKLISERDEQTAHLASMEVSFSDLHSKYEKSKQIILSMKANEDTYKKSLNEFEVNLLKMQTNYDLLKQHATSKLNHANQELEKYNRAHDAEVLKLNAMIKRKELHITSLEESLSQKTKANEELTAICDELINKVG